MTDPSDMYGPLSSPGGQQGCRRCGRCCRKGGPCLHIEDNDLINDNSLSLAELYSIRPGEPVWDNIAGRQAIAAEDIIKIKNRPDTTTCLFFNAVDRSCACYTVRPLECRVLKCWDPVGLIDIYDKERLTRKYILKNHRDMWEIAAAHQVMCDYDRIGQMVRDNDRPGLAHLIRYDRAYRDLLVEKKVVQADVLDFLLGLPLAETVRRYGLSSADIFARSD